ncbi:MAG: Gfo/Idh/MocA family oxidoreductase [Planctomycetes bacterium]|nr:Gfo/Idh/MocA family oxidoreductase [Planctomycetota bacterium]
MAAPVAIVAGAGSISNAWFPPLQAEKVKVAAVVDIRRDAAEAQIEKYGLRGAKASDSLPATLRDTRADFLVDLTIPEAHCKVVCAGLRAGLHVIGEKPMAASMAEARKMVRTSEQTGKLYMVSQSRRWNRLHDRIARTVSKGALGTVSTLNCDFFLAAHFGGFRDAMESPLILDMAIHHFDLARMLCGKDPAAVYAREFNPKGSWYKGDVAANCIFEMTDNVFFAYRGSWCSEGCHTSWNGNWRIIGDRGTLVYDNDAEPRGEVLAGKKGFIRPHKPLKVVKSPLKHDTMRGALREMLVFLRGGGVPQSECHDNIKSLAMVFGAIESSRKGRRVPVRAL